MTMTMNVNVHEASADNYYKDLGKISLIALAFIVKKHNYLALTLTGQQQ